LGKCSQCNKPAVFKYNDGSELCVEHHLMMQKAESLRLSMMASYVNALRDDIEAGTGIPPGCLARMKIPNITFNGDTLTLNNINVSGSTIGAINTGTIKNLDVSISLLRGKGESELAESIKELIQAIIYSNEIQEDLKNEIAQQLEFLVAQVSADPSNRNIGVVKSVLARMPSLICVTASLITIWDKLEPLLKSAFGTN